MDTSISRSRYILYLLLLVGLLAFFIVRPFIVVLFLAVIFAVALYPIYAAMLSRLKIRASLAALCTLLVASLCVLIPLFFIGTQVFTEAQQVYGSIVNGSTAWSEQALSLRLGSWIGQYVPGASAYLASFSANINVYLKQILDWAVQNFGGIFSSIAELLFELFIFCLALYYLLTDGIRLQQNILAWSPLAPADTEALMRHLSGAITSLVRGRIVISCMQGAAAGIGFFLFGVPNALLWGILTVITSLVPNIGSWLVLFPAALYLFLLGNTYGALGLAIWGIVTVLVIDNVIGPRLSRNGTQLNPLFTIISILGGVAFFGPSGILLGPIVVSLFFAVFGMYQASSKNKRRKRLANEAVGQ